MEKDPIKICKCRACRAWKRKCSKNQRRYVKKCSNRKRRRLLGSGKVENFYYS